MDDDKSYLFDDYRMEPIKMPKSISTKLEKIICQTLEVGSEVTFMEIKYEASESTFIDLTRVFDGVYLVIYDVCGGGHFYLEGINNLRYFTGWFALDDHFEKFIYWILDGMKDIYIEGYGVD